MKVITLGTALLLAACSGGDDSDEPEDFTCSVLSRSGTYLMTLTELDGGTCGELPASVVRVDPGEELEPGCVLDKPTVVSSDECSVTESLTCTDEFGITSSIEGVSRQASADGSLITGVVTLYVSDAQGPVCVSTYRARYERQ